MSERALTRALVAERPRRLYGLCIFCGWPCRGSACASHKDLLFKDPHYVALSQGGTNQ